MSMDIFWSKIVEVQDYAVVLDVLTDEHLHEIEKRTFSIEPFSDHISLIPGVYVKIQIETRPGVYQATFDEMSISEIEKYSHFFEMIDLNLELKKSN